MIPTCTKRWEWRGRPAPGPSTAPADGRTFGGFLIFRKCGFTHIHTGWITPATSCARRNYCPHRANIKCHKAKKERHLRGLAARIYCTRRVKGSWDSSSLDHVLRGRPKWEFWGGCRVTSARASGDPGGHTNLGRRGQSRASPAPMWRLGVQCERSVRDLIGLAAPALAKPAARPARWRMEAGALVCLPAGATAAEAARRRTVGVNPLAPGSWCVDGRDPQ